jgi:TPR repeat protein
MILGLSACASTQPPSSAPSSTGTDDPLAEQKAKCEAGDAMECLQLGGRYKFGADGAPKDIEVSFQYHRKACDLGLTTGCVQLGYFYAKGMGVDKDPSQAFKLFSSACEQNDANGCDSLSEAYQKGWGTAADPDKAATASAKACSLDSEFCH